MQMGVIAVGKLKERYWRDAQAEYVKRLSGYVQIQVEEVADEPAGEDAAEAERLRVLRAEGARIERRLRARDAVVALDRKGKQFSSEAWSQTYQQLVAGGHGRIVFVIGGSLGLADTVLQRADLRWSFGPLTLPHQLARIVLLEQVYRGIRIARGEPYHK
ncbi:MAG: 23S rRNA (pseudouridine(1915)-N(3))-methyltransferase RlmH [Alicyclobacillus herbarius]|uniref:23S rRNA (pseudouridine(1915)-N(3))-methyltransferase RlmH n=1 Tax=Alicyclobacillus herbarius TaxID=122960 RepID=UPI002353EE57|nr:23S rRNA (pseudouridine(1915)-N(3))-methyltransferase RlmH [Alicyclobacillus herbarius]MCL6631749.1 23S rRNA (pseudouridine(1915)-N(3))-methyltransferase RlmH [Alicyclobacillus herbarius]